jgi:multicomponent Na+:H+ antiporter subunit E
VRGRRFVLACAGGFFIWLLMVGTLDPAELLAGAVVAVLTALIAGPHLGLLDGVRLGAAMPWHMARFFWTFLVALLQSNLDMARRVLSPSLPIRPGIVEVGTELRSELGRLLLANAITLTPGTLSVDVIGDRLLVHWVDVPPGADRALATRSIAAGFERHLKGFLR